MDLEKVSFVYVPLRLEDECMVALRPGDWPMVVDRRAEPSRAIMVSSEVASRIKTHRTEFEPCDSSTLPWVPKPETHHRKELR